jgi:hypothetical protein
MNGMCNQFQSLAHQIATLLDGNIKGSIISVRFEYKEYFPNLKNMKMVKLYDSKTAEKILTFCYKITRNLLRNNRIFFDYHYYSDEGEKLEKYIYSEGFRYLNAFSGWPYYDQKAFLKHETQIRELFALSKDIEGKVTVQLQDMRKHCDILIGVHIRRGDYKEFKNGEYYYTDEQYIDTCEKLKNIINGRVGFVLSSNDVINIEQWRQKLGGMYGKKIQILVWKMYHSYQKQII